MTDYRKAKLILKKDKQGLCFITKDIEEQIQKDIDECLKKQDADIENSIRKIHEMIQQKFKGDSSEFMLFVIKNISIETYQ